MAEGSHMRVTASKSALLLSPCSRWAHNAARWMLDRAEDNGARDNGIAIHDAIDLYVKDLPYTVQDDLIPDVEAACRYVDSLRRQTLWLLSEVAFGSHIDSFPQASVVNCTGRNYPRLPGVFYGTADIVAKLDSESLLVADWKTGQTDGSTEQLLTLGAMALSNYDAKRLRIATLAINDGRVWEDSRDVGQAELDAHAAGVLSRIDSLDTSAPMPPVPGTHCTAYYCPHMAHCPAIHLDMARLSPDDGTGWVGEFEDPSNPTSAGKLAFRLRAAKRSLKYYEGLLKDYVKDGNKATYNGYEYSDLGNGFRIHKLR